MMQPVTFNDTIEAVKDLVRKLETSDRVLALADNWDTEARAVEAVNPGKALVLRSAAIEVREAVR
jgi:hypothetical protein